MLKNAIKRYTDFLFYVMSNKYEEEFFEKGLEGYREYKKKVKYRLIPLIW